MLRFAGWRAGLSPEREIRVEDGDSCKVVKGTHDGKSGVVRDVNTSESGNVTSTVVQANGERFKTLARSVEVTRRR
jgi:ribosomal protein S4E